MKLGWSQFAQKNNNPSSGFSYTTLTDDQVVELVLENWDKRTPGNGETDTTRKILVPVPTDGFFAPPRVKLELSLPVQAQVAQRQDGENLYVEHFVTAKDAQNHDIIEINPTSVNIVCYSAEALLENDGTRSTDCDWEIVAILAGQGNEPMTPLTMARNMLEMPGGTKGSYSAQEFAEAIWYWANQGVRIK